jgi:hypothetical protein
MHEVSTEHWSEMPEPVRAIDRMWRLSHRSSAARVVRLTAA